MSSSGGEKGGELDKPGRCLLIPSATGPNCNDVMISLGECFAINQVIDNEEKRGAIKQSFPHGHGYAHPANEQVRSRNEDIVYGKKYVSTPVMEVTSGKSYSMGTTSKVTDGKQDARRGTLEWKEVYRIADRNEIKLAKIPMDRGSVELYGYIAVRDCLDPLLNYIVNISRYDPVIMEQGSLIEMSGPKRGIDMYGDALLEYDMRIKTGDREEDDLQLIDGVSVLPDIILRPCNPYTNRLRGDHGAVDITRALLYKAVEATVEVAISEVRSNFDLSLSSFTSGIDKEIQLFGGAIGEPRRLRRFVDYTNLALKPDSEPTHCSAARLAIGPETQPTSREAQIKLYL
ncbi:unnamed protein product [Miscanthus lutarioriparius]|uniref:DUF6598 domain-containing protein n=1 Tax=Miscanthus lutarioriparius TaxID=422564 RepID=A0A811QF97_9POAL|nr:unnamed protein product [Miscanthus lutarioriparius]